jgi:type I restriction-modification system DNA methylase subunit
MITVENHPKSDINRLIEGLGYTNDSGLLDLETSQLPSNLAHHFYRAQRSCGLKAVYALRDINNSATIPLVYLSEAENEAMAKEIHRLVWNQNLVPFLVVSTPNRYVLFPGFSYEKDNENQEIAEIVKDARQSLEYLHNFQGLYAQSIANGNIWEQLGSKINLEKRVDWALLDQLKKLSYILRDEYGLNNPHEAHALIGKYIYLHYLKDRNILSPERFSEWNLSANTVFGREATLAGFIAINERLDDWLNGSVFPVHIEPNDYEKYQKLIQLTAAVFSGDTTYGQMHLDFAAYNFAHIPIETLSVIYEQFLHAEDKGREKGAYYTPIPLVELILDEMATRRPLVSGMSILDPACGSGVFLVQAYRRLIEQQRSTSQILNPDKLGDLLTRHIFGIDQDKDACRVACLSLLLTLLDYIDPPDLCQYPNFKLPDLYGSNIVKGDFFQSDFPWKDRFFDWIVGNPPWLELKPKKPKPDHVLALAWIQAHSKDCPVGGYQIAEAFCWKTIEHLATEGIVGLLMPAMSLFKQQSIPFRQAFFSQLTVWCIANFANLAPILFGGRIKVPVAALFFKKSQGIGDFEEDVVTYSPFLANQPTLQQDKGKRFKESWVITVNGGELHRVDRNEAIRGEGLTWKIAMWGSFRDRRLLERTTKRFPSFSEFKKQHHILAHQGLELRDYSKLEDKEKEFVEFIPELEGKYRLRPKLIARLKKRIYGFPKKCLEELRRDLCWGRKGRIKTSLSVCYPTHLVLGRNRKWAVYSDDFIVVPDRQLGIAGSQGQENLLKALALYLVSDFVFYHQLFYSAEMGVQKNVADKIDIEKLPIPFDSLKPDELNQWASLYDQLEDCWNRKQEELLQDSEYYAKTKELEHIANEYVYQALGIRESERCLIKDLVHSRLQLIQGKMGDSVIKKPQQEDLKKYGEALCRTLDNFINREGGQSHQVEILRGDDFGVASITFTNRNSNSANVIFSQSSPKLRNELKSISQLLQKKHNHWLYFERSLTLFDNDRILLIKPMQRLHWLQSQALQDADNLISDILSGEQVYS